MLQTLALTASASVRLMAEVFEHFSRHFPRGAETFREVSALRHELAEESAVLLMGSATLGAAPDLCGREHLQALQALILLTAQSADRLADVKERNQSAMQVVSALAELTARHAEAFSTRVAPLYEGELRARIDAQARAAGQRRVRLVRLLRALTVPPQSA